MTVSSTSTIAAIATPLGRGGIGIIKISGPQAISVAEKLFRPRTYQQPESSSRYPFSSPSNWISHRLNHGIIVNPVTGQVIDEVLLSVMAAPHSYTREDVVEINAHSGVFVLKEIFQLVVKAGATPAQPGEFTKRAFLNGRIDLVQAEAVIDLINSRSRHAADLATRQLQTGSAAPKLKAIREHILQILAVVEAAIDFPDDLDGEDAPHPNASDIDHDIILPLKELIFLYDSHRLYREGLRVAIVGRPNVGKSSILNRLIESERAIVTDIPGTTRDLIDVDLYIKGLPVIITDTAGLRKTEDQIEVEGIRKTRERIRDADIVLFVVAMDDGIMAYDQKIFEELTDCHVVLVLNKADRVDTSKVEKLMAWKAENPRITVSALLDPSFERMRNLIFEQFIHGDGEGAESDFVPNLRQKESLERCLNSMLAYISLVKQSAPGEIVALEIRSALQALDELSGGTFNEELLDQIFNRFCIGK
ncbi:MAG: tRNA uridine-5-carboxymethylaminomethyl(34) synthesis GTPase MnmE [Desulfobacterales bacterium]